MLSLVISRLFLKVNQALQQLIVLSGGVGGLVGKATIILQQKDAHSGVGFGHSESIPPQAYFPIG
jgi:hypothetical protein